MIHIAARYLIVRALEEIRDAETFSDHAEMLDLVISTIRVSEASTIKDYLIILVTELRSFDWT